MTNPEGKQPGSNAPLEIMPPSLNEAVQSQDQNKDGVEVAPASELDQETGAGKGRTISSVPSDSEGTAAGDTSVDVISQPNTAVDAPEAVDATNKVSTQDQEAQMSGYLFKEGRRYHMKTKRYMTIQGSILCNYKSETDVQPTWQENLLQSKAYVGSRTTEIIVDLPNQKKLIFFAPLVEEQKTWIEAFKKAAQGNINNFYDLGPIVAKGALQTFRKVTRKSDGKIFITKISKRIQGDEDSIRRADLELDIVKQLKTMQYPYLAPILDIFNTKSKIYYVHEYIQGGSLKTRIFSHGPLKESVAQHICRQVIDATRILHHYKIVHRNIKLRNILLSTQDPDVTTPNAYFSSVSTAVRIPELHKSVLHGQVGTPYYIAPEILRHREYSEKVDIWSIGVVMYYALSGQMPFGYSSQDQNVSQVEDILTMIKAASIPTFDSVRWENISEKAKSFVSAMLNVIPERRLDAVAALQHPWLNEHYDDDNTWEGLSSFPPRKRWRILGWAVYMVNQFAQLKLLENEHVFGDHQEGHKGAKFMKAAVGRIKQPKEAFKSVLKKKE